LKDLLPGFIVEYDEREGLYKLVRPRYSIGLLKSFFGNTIPLVWAFAYILAMGSEGLREVAEQAVLVTNYFVKLIESVRGYSFEYGADRLRKHETVISARPMYEDTGITAEDVAKGLLDRGFYAPTMYFPLIVKEALMIEFTETEPVENVEEYAKALRELSELAYTNPEQLKKAPVNTSVGRVDNVKANHPRTLAPTWRVYVKRVQSGVEAR